MIFSLKLNKPLLAFHKKNDADFGLNYECDRIDVLAIVPSHFKHEVRYDFDYRALTHLPMPVQTVSNTYVCRCSDVNIPLMLDDLDDLIAEEFYVFADVADYVLARQVKEMEKARAEIEKEKAAKKKPAKRKPK